MCLLIWKKNNVLLRQNKRKSQARVDWRDTKNDIQEVNQWKIELQGIL